MFGLGHREVLDGILVQVVEFLAGEWLGQQLLGVVAILPDFVVFNPLMPLRFVGKPVQQSFAPAFGFVLNAPDELFAGKLLEIAQEVGKVIAFTGGSN